jgi:hypothetical protein
MVTPITANAHFKKKKINHPPFQTEHQATGAKEWLITPDSNSHCWFFRPAEVQVKTQNMAILHPQTKTYLICYMW